MEDLEMFRLILLIAFSTFSLPAAALPTPHIKNFWLHVGHHRVLFQILTFDSRLGYVPAGIYSPCGETCHRALVRSGSVHTLQLGYINKASSKGTPEPVDLVRTKGHNLFPYLKRTQRPLLGLSKLGGRIINPSKHEWPVAEEGSVFALDDRFQYPNIRLRRHFIYLTGSLIVVDQQSKLHRFGPQSINLVYAPNATQWDYEAFKNYKHLTYHQVIACDGDTACNPSTRANSHLGILLF